MKDLKACMKKQKQKKIMGNIIKYFAASEDMIYEKIQACYLLLEGKIFLSH